MGRAWTSVILLSLTSLTGASRPVAALQPTGDIEPGVRISGAGPETYVLLSGLMGGVAGFRRLENLLVANGHRVIVIDPYRLSVDSADLSFTALARRVERVLEVNHVAVVRLAGHSHGGGVALRVAALNPDRVSALYLLDVGALPSQRGTVLSASLRLVPIIARIPGGKAFIRGRILSGLRENSGRTDWLDAATQRVYSEPLTEHIGSVIRMALRLSRTRETTSVREIVARVSAPTTVLLGLAAHSSGPESGELLALEPLRRLRIEHIPGAGHFIHEEAPELVAALLAPRALVTR